ncbi:MAG TPA: CotS family spore coat protein, partial [Clostridium perfringens]|nr:CotS family spore coat protein [Clostridium perfringens]
MNKIRYKDEKYLCRYDLDIKLFEALGLDIFDLRPNRNVFLLDTKQGKKILKMINYDDDRLSFIIHSTEYLRERYDGILKINKLPNGEWRFKWKENDYILLDYFEGTEFNIANPIELEIITEAVAKLHNAGMGIQEADSKEMNEKNSELFKLKDYFINSKKDLEKLKEIVGRYKYKNEFDEIFIKEVDYHLSDIKVCIDLLEKSKYDDLCRDKEKITLCHNDLAYHNILFNQN